MAHSGALPKLTLDTNCIIAVEEHRPSEKSILSLRRLHDVGIVQLRLVAASASERQVRGQQVQNFNDWAARVSKLGFGGLEILKPIMIYGVGFYGQGVYGGGAASELYDAIGTAIFRSWFPARVERPPSANKICDVLMMWAHIWYQGDCFVTTDVDDFLRETTFLKLIKLGARSILTPEDAEQRFKATKQASVPAS